SRVSWPGARLANVRERWPEEENSSTSGARLQRTRLGYAASVRRAPAATAVTAPANTPSSSASASQARHRPRKPARRIIPVAVIGPHPFRCRLCERIARGNGGRTTVTVVLALQRNGCLMPSPGARRAKEAGKPPGGGLLTRRIGRAWDGTNHCRPARERAMTNLAQIVVDAQAAHGGRLAVRQGSLAMTYGELATACGRAAALLRDAGVQPGDRVALMLPNVLAF